MLRNAEVPDPDIFRPLVPKNLPNGGHENNVPEIKKHVSFLENKIRGKLDLGKGLHFENARLPDCDEMPRLESSPLLDGLDGVPASPEMPTLVPFVFDGEDVKNGLDAHLSINGYYCLNKENMNLSSPDTTSPTTKKRKPGRPKRRPKSVYSAELATSDKRFQPVVLLKRLCVEQEVVDANSRDHEDSSDIWSQWPEEYEGCSYDDYVCDGEGVVNFPEVDMIDGVEFLSFLQEGDVKEYALKSNQTIIFPSDTSCTDAESCPDGVGNLKDDHAFIVPTKTRDITQIKGWKRKLFLEDNFASSTPSSMSPNFLESDSADRDDESSQEALLLESSQEALHLERSSVSGSNSATPFEEKDQSQSDFSFNRRTHGGALSETKLLSDEDGDSKRASDGESEEESGREMSDRSFQNSLRLEESDVENPQSFCEDQNDNDSNIVNEKRGSDLSKAKSSKDSDDQLLESDDNNNDAIRDSEISFQNSLRLPGTPPDGDQFLEDDDEEKESKSFDPVTNREVGTEAGGESGEMSNPLESEPEEGPLQEDNVLKLGEQPDLYGSAKSAAFSSRSLDDFLDKHSALDVNFLMQCDPIVSFIPSNDPVLKVGLLKVEDDSRKRNRPFGVFPRNMRYTAQSSPGMRPSASKNSGGHAGKPDRVLSTSKFEYAKPQTKKVPPKFPKPPSDKKEQMEPEVQKESGEVRPNLVFADDDDSNMSSSSESSNSTGISCRKDSMSPDFSLDSNERRDACLDNSLLFENNDLDKDYENFSIEYYEPVTYEDCTLSESQSKEPSIIKQTVWSTKDTVREERLFYDLLCQLKSPDSYLISKIKFYDEAGADVNELLTEDDAKEIAKSLYMGYNSVQEMVKEVTELHAIKKARVAKSMQMARERKRKKEAQLKTVRGFVEWYRADTLTPEELVSRKRTRNRVPSDLASPISAEDRSEDAAEEIKKKRKIRVPARFMDSAFLSEEGQTIFKDKRNPEKTYSRNKLPILRPHSAALPIGFNDPDGTPVSPSMKPDIKTESGSSDESPILLSSPDLTRRSGQTPPPVGSPPTCSLSESESEAVLTSSQGEDPEKLPKSASSSPLVSISDVRSLSKDDVSFSIQKDSLPKSPDLKEVESKSTERSNGNSEISLSTAVTDPPELTVTKVSGPNYDSVLDLIDNSNNKEQQKTPDKSSSLPDTRKVPMSPGSTKDYLGIELSNGVHTITPKNSTIQKIKMNLNSAVNIDTKARNVMQKRQPVPPGRTWNVTNVLHLIPLNEYHWKPPNSSDNSPTIKSFIINKPNTDAALIFNQDTVNMPLAAVAQPVTNKQTSIGQIFLLYGSLKDMNLPVTEIPVAEKAGSSKGLSVRVGQQELFLSCSVTLAKAPIRLNALVGKVVTPLLVFPALTSNTNEGTEASQTSPDKIRNENDQQKTVVPKPVVAAPKSVPSLELPAVQKTQDQTLSSKISSGLRSILTHANNSSVVPLKTLVPARGAKAQNPQHLRIFMKDNKLTVENRETQNSNTNNLSSFLSPTQRTPPTFANATGGPTRPVQHVRPLQLARPLVANQRTVVPTNAGPKKVFILSPTDRRAFLPPGVFRPVMKPPPAKAATCPELVTPKVVNPVTGKVQPLTVCGQSAGPKSQLLKTTLSLPEGFGSPPGRNEYICVQAPNRQLHPLPKGSVQGDSNLLLLGKEGDVQVMGIGSELSSPQLGSRLENSHSAQSLQECAEDANLEISITDVRTCSPATFGSGPDSSDQSEAANRSSEIVQVSSDEVVDVPSEEEREEDADSMWVNNEGEPCFVMRLPDEEEVEELSSDEIHVVPCS